MRRDILECLYGHVVGARQEKGGMAISEAAYLKILWDQNVCPHCGGVIEEGKRCGSGQKLEGGFCSLECYSKYHAPEFAERARLLKGTSPPLNDC
jgi:hypothetical protein